MGILSAMTKSVGGLNAQSFALENISGNIANTQTTGFKRTETSFQSLLASNGGRVSATTSGGVTASSRATNDIAGSIDSDDSPTSMAIQGDGYFVVRKKSGESDGNSIFSTEDLYTRRGDFSVDREGYLVNGSDYYLSGLKLDPDSGNPVGDAVDLIKIDTKGIGAEVTTKINYELNLPEVPLTQNATNFPDTPDSEKWDLNGATAIPATVTADDSDQFEENSITGSAITCYDANGTPVNLQFRWAKVDNSFATDGNTTDTWVCYYKSDSEATGTADKWTQMGTYEFQADGQLNAIDGDTTATSVTLTGLTIDGATIGDVTVRHGTGGLTQQADSNGTVSITEKSQDGVPAGDFVDVEISDEGQVIANYSNGRSVPIFEIPLVAFAGDSALRRLDGEAYSPTSDSGPAVYGASGSIVGSSLESSNVDLGDEFTKLIVTQQAFSANSRAITTANDMLSEVLNIIR